MLQERVDEAGHRTTKRTIERDLIDLSAVFPLVLDDRNRPYGWSWRKGAPDFSVPGLSVEESLAIHLVQRFLEPLLPPQVADRLQPYFRNAKQVLDATARPGPGSWPEKVRSVPTNQPLIAPAAAREAFGAVSEALVRERQLEVRYTRRGEKTSVEMRVHPLGIVQRGPVSYLVCTVFRYSDIRLLALHRIRSASVRDEPAERPAGFNLDSYIESGALGFSKGRTIRLNAVFREGAGDHLYETPLDPKQRLDEIEPGTLRLIASFTDTSQLRWWLLGFGDLVEVVSPKSLRDEFSRIAKSLARRYC